MRRFASWRPATLKNMARIIGAGPLIVIETEVLAAHRSKPAYRRSMSSTVQIETPDSPTLPMMSGRSAGSSPYSVTESNAVDRRTDDCPRDT